MMTSFDYLFSRSGVVRWERDFKGYSEAAGQRQRCALPEKGMLEPSKNRKKAVLLGFANTVHEVLLGEILLQCFVTVLKMYAFFCCKTVTFRVQLIFVSVMISANLQKWDFTKSRLICTSIVGRPRFTNIDIYQPGKLWWAKISRTRKIVVLRHCVVSTYDSFRSFDGQKVASLSPEER